MKRLFLVLVLVVFVSVPRRAEEHAGCRPAPGLQRTVANLDNGVTITLTCSDPKMVAEVQARAAKGCDSACPLSAGNVTRAVENTADGVVVTATSTDPAVVKALQEHAAKGCSHGEPDGRSRCKHGEGATNKAPNPACPLAQGEGATKS